MPSIAHLGDTTTHFGTVVTASDDVKAEGRGVARIGDWVFCPMRGTPENPDGPIHGLVQIVTGASTVIVNSRGVATHGSLCTCGAAVISTGTVNVE
ncbi:MAG: PAAR domain-containing protein [Chromatiaceae bacterium]|nr:PAAR domain-containing protein [Chromatiaceae bacterium]